MAAFDVLGLRDARYVAADQSAVDLEVNFASTGWIEFTATSTDTAPHGQDVWARILAGEAGAIAPYVAPAPIFSALTFRQLVLALWQAGFISQVEALAAAETRTRPAAFDAVIAALPEADQIAARITWATMTQVYRDDVLFAALIGSGQATGAQIDTIFTLGAAL